jgi:hypothetical protein
MKNFFAFTCILIIAGALCYMIGYLSTDVYNISDWTVNAQNYLIAGTINITLFSSLWVFEQNKFKTYTTVKKYINNKFTESIMDSIRAEEYMNGNITKETQS